MSYWTLSLSVSPNKLVLVLAGPEFSKFLMAGSSITSTLERGYVNVKPLIEKCENSGRSRTSMVGEAQSVNWNCKKNDYRNSDMTLLFYTVSSQKETKLATSIRLSVNDVSSEEREGVWWNCYSMAIMYRKSGDRRGWGQKKNKKKCECRLWMIPIFQIECVICLVSTFYHLLKVVPVALTNYSRDQTKQVEKQV